MKSIFILFLLLSSMLLNAQSNLHVVTRFDFSREYNYYLGFSQNDREYIKSNHIKSQTTESVSNGKTKKSVSKYDSQGNILSMTSYNTKGELSGSTVYEYDTGNRLVSTRTTYKKHTQTRHYYYNNKNMLVETRGYNHKGDYTGNKDIYDVNGHLQAQLIFRKDSVNPCKRLEHAYYEDGSKESIRYYIGNKLKYTWSFECKESGELVKEKTQDSTLICIKEEHDTHGNRVVWKQEFNAKGEPQKVRFVYDKDSTLLSQTQYSAEEDVRSHTQYFKDGGYLSRHYDKKGRIYSTYERIYNCDQQLVKTSSSYQKSWGMEWYAYENGLLSSRVHTYANAYGRHSSNMTYSYTFY